MTTDPAECESCGRPDSDLVAVHRMYVVPEDWDQEGRQTVVEELEIWCFSCRSQYPNVLPGDTPP